MNIFSKKQELFDVIEEQKKTIQEKENEIEQLKSIISTHLETIRVLEQDKKNLLDKKDEYEKKFIYTNFDCEFCYTTLQEDYQFCPKCGRKIERIVCVENLNQKNCVFEVEEDGEEYLIVQYNGFNERKITIPASINGRTVSGVWNNVFENCETVEEIFFENGCKYIGREVFKNCKRLKRVRLPKTLLEIGGSSFEGCTVLEELAIPPNIKVIGGMLFAYCKNLKTVLLPEGIKSISSGMFYHSGITEISIPQSVVKIGSSAFLGSKLKRIELPYNVHTIRMFAFKTSDLEEITIHSNVTIMENDIFEKFSKPVIKCAAGSKAHLYARKYRIQCEEISRVKPVNPVMDVQAVEVEFTPYMSEKDYVDCLNAVLNVSKAETWSWVKKGVWSIWINKSMDEEEAEQIRKKVQQAIDRVSDTRYRKITSVKIIQIPGRPDV